MDRRGEAHGEKRETPANDAEKESRDVKKRRLQVMASEKRLLGQIARHVGTSSERRKMNAMLMELEYGTGVKRERKWDISNIIGALEAECDSPHEEGEELERLRSLYEGVYFMDDMPACENWTRTLS